MSRLALYGLSLLLLFSTKCHPKISDPIASESVTKIRPFGGPEKLHPIIGYPKFLPHTLFATQIGNNVNSILKGNVVLSDYSRNYGHSVIVESFDTIRIRYFHLSECLVDSGEKVKSGQIIAKTGNSGLSTAPVLGVRLEFNEKPMALCHFIDCSKYKKDTSTARPKSCVGPFR